MKATPPRTFTIALLFFTLAACGGSAHRAEPTTPVLTTTSPLTTTTSATSASTTDQGASSSSAAPLTTTTVGADGDVLPIPDGPFAVGVRTLDLPWALAFYPAIRDTGAGTRPYFDPQLLLASGLDEHLFDRAVTHAELDADPAPATTGRPVVVISSGFGSYLEFSTTLIERIASHGYIVIAVQPEVPAEAAVETPTDAMRDARLAQMTAVLDYLTRPDLAELVGPVALDRVALGGHSYAGSIAFNTAILDERVTAAFDLDGSLFDAAQTTPTPVPSLVLSTTGASAQDERIAALLPNAPNTIAVGLVGANHYDVTDIPALAQDPGLASVVSRFGLGTIGATATTTTSTIVIRFLDAALAPTPRLATGAELIADLPDAITDPFHLGS